MKHSYVSVCTETTPHSVNLLKPVKETSYNRSPDKMYMRSLQDAHGMNVRLVVSVCLSACCYSRTAERIWMKFRMVVMPLGTTLESYVLIFYNRTCQHGGTNL
jgi:hypothetical protein